MTRVSRPPTDAEMEALSRRYARWAGARGLDALAEDNHRFEGRILTRDIAFRTGLGGSAPHPPDIVVLVELAIEEPVLLTRRNDVASSELTKLMREVLDATKQLRNVGLTATLVRMTFEPGAEDDAFDAALEALEERLRLIGTAPQLPYRS